MDGVLVWLGLGGCRVGAGWVPGCRFGPRWDHDGQKELPFRCLLRVSFSRFCSVYHVSFSRGEKTGTGVLLMTVPWRHRRGFRGPSIACDGNICKTIYQLLAPRPRPLYRLCQARKKPEKGLGKTTKAWAGFMRCDRTPTPTAPLPPVRIHIRITTPPPSSPIACRPQTLAHLQ